MAEPNESLSELEKLEPPKRLADGSLNPDHLRWAYRSVNQLSIDAIYGRREIPKGMNLAQIKDLFDAEARANRMDPKHIMDVRTREQVFEDAMRIIVQAPTELFAQADEILSEMERQMDRADTLLVDECGASGKNVRDKREAADYAKKPGGNGSRGCAACVSAPVMRSPPETRAATSPRSRPRTFSAL